MKRNKINSVKKKKFTCGRSYKYHDESEEESTHLFLSNGWFVRAKVNMFRGYLPESKTYVYELRDIKRIKKRRDLEQPLPYYDFLKDLNS